MIVSPALLLPPPPFMPLLPTQVSAKVAEAREMLGEREEGAKRALAQREELAGQRSELQNQQRDLFQREADLSK